MSRLSRFSALPSAPTRSGLSMPDHLLQSRLRQADPRVLDEYLYIQWARASPRRTISACWSIRLAGPGAEAFARTDRAAFLTALSIAGRSWARSSQLIRV